MGKKGALLRPCSVVLHFLRKRKALESEQWVIFPEELVNSVPWILVHLFHRHGLLWDLVSCYLRSGTFLTVVFPSLSLCPKTSPL